MAKKKKKQTKPTNFTPERVEKFLEEYSKGENTVKEICEAVGWSESAYYQYRELYPDFAERINQADKERLERMGLLAQKGMQRLLEGDTVEETTTEFEMIQGEDGERRPQIKSRRVAQKNYQPNSRMVEFALTNAYPNIYKTRQAIEHEHGKGKGDEFLPLEYLNDDELEQLEEILEKARARKIAAERED